MKLLLAFLCFVTSSLFCNSVHMKNDSPYQLRAVVRGHDGSYLGEMIIAAQGIGTWSDNTYGAVPLTEWGLVDQTSTPYTVLWYCMSGDTYSVNSLVPTGALVSAQFGEGARQCSPKKEKQATEQNPSQGYLHNQNEPESRLQ